MVFNQAKGKYISRIDGHTVYPEDYFSKAINILKNQSVDVVGGPAKHIGTSWKGEIIATCMMHPLEQAILDSAFLKKSSMLILSLSLFKT